jgi:hypothetical protein
MDDLHAILLVVVTYLAPNYAALGLVTYFAYKYEHEISMCVEKGVDRIKDSAFFKNLSMSMKSTTTVAVVVQNAPIVNVINK